VTDPENPVLVGVLPTRGTPDYVLWRDAKVLGNYAYIVSEVSGSGLQIFDLTQLRGRTDPTIFTSTASYDEFSYAHNIHINEATETAYVVGSNTCGNGEENGGLHMVDLSDPVNPTFAGCAVVDDAGNQPESNNYVHDVECVVYDGPDRTYRGREICFGSNENAVVIYDVTDRSAPRILSATTYENATYTHQGSLTEDRRYFLFADELDEQQHGINTTTYVLDVSDLDAPPEPKPFVQETEAIDHNMYVHGNRVIQSNYTAGVRILDFTSASLAEGRLEEVGYFDVVPGTDFPEFAGTWSNYRFPGSGTLVASTIENESAGMFVLQTRLPDPPSDGKGKGSGKGKGKPSR
jgi:choice-of-anchor B domain-containing protein